ncbi:MAG TPA: hypothetical protein VFR23_25320 [Jiangellaceae bacterium]|nr:hypothetical protein [Jiangellaceae bacterium]
MSTRDDVKRIVTSAILARPRNHQVAIGPSGIGTECDRCLGHMLAGTPRMLTPDWQPYVGVSVHAQLEQIFLEAGLNGRWATETKVWVGDIDGQEIHGQCDLLDARLGGETVVDFKTASKTRLKAVKSSGQPSQRYRVQAHLYGRGWQHNGVDVKNVAIWYLPRDGGLEQALWWEEPYDERVALSALARADAFAKAIRILGTETFLPTLQRNSDCFDCKRYPAYPTDPPLPTGQAAAFADLIPA